MQEVFEKANRGLKNFRGKSSLSTWLYRIATNTVLDKLKSGSLKISYEDFDLETDNRDFWNVHKNNRVDHQLIRKEMSECVSEYINKLPLAYRTVLILSEIKGFKNKEIAEVLGVSLETVKIRLHRARSSLKKELNEGCSFYHNEQNILACDRKSAFIKINKTK
jgi:RNA polymerase sigma-70 factor (ECF subfamily)